MTHLFDELKIKCSEATWFHAIDFGGFATSGRFPGGAPQNITLFGFMDIISDIPLQGKTVLDIGTSDGLAAFGMKSLGAKEVVAIDSFDLPTFRLAREALGVDVEYIPGVQIKDAVAKLGTGRFDLVLCAGVIYHMLNPMSAFIAARKLLRPGGLLILETAIVVEPSEPVMVLNSESDLALPEIYTYWLPTESCVIGMMRLLGFAILAVRKLKAPHRITIVGRRVAPSDVSDKKPILQRIHEVDLCDFEFRFRDETTAEASSIVYCGAGGRSEIDAATFTPNFPFHPKAPAETVGRTRWTRPEGNR